jgi:hypothetical protein
MDLIAFVGAVVGAILINLIASELFAWSPRLSEWLMRCAVQRLVPGMRERMREEWAAHLQTIPPGLSRIVEAAGFLIASLPFSSAARVGVSTDKLPTPSTAIGPTGPTGTASFAGTGSFGVPTGPTGTCQRGP